MSNEEKLLKQGFVPVAVQDECFRDKKEGIIVLVRHEKQGKRNLLTRYGALAFPDENYLEKWMNEVGIDKATPEKKFKAPRIEQLKHLIAAI